MMGAVEVMITALLMEISMEVLSPAPATSPAMVVPVTMLRRNSITGNCRDLRYMRAWNQSFQKNTAV